MLEVLTLGLNCKIGFQSFDRIAFSVQTFLSLSDLDSITRNVLAYDFGCQTVLAAVLCLLAFFVFRIGFFCVMLPQVH